MTLQIAIETINDTDFDDLPISYKQGTAKIDGSEKLKLSADIAMTDEDLKTQIKTKLTSLGYTWSEEI